MLPLLVSCLCPTYGRVALLRRAVGCFLKQTYEPRELVIVCQAHDSATKDYFGALRDATIRAVEIPPSPELGPGSLRNIAMQSARGKYVAVWDDDDWHGPTRLAEQIGVLEQTAKPACALSRLILYDATTQLAFMSGSRAWEATLVAERESMPAYSDSKRGSDTSLLAPMLAEKKVMSLDHPDLYVHVYHGGNTWSREHWEKDLLTYARPLSHRETKRVRAILESEGQ